MYKLPVFWAIIVTLLSTTLAQSSNSTCANILSPSYEFPVVGSGWTAQLIATNLTSPRGIVFDSTGALLVVQQGVGILRVTFTDSGGTCLAVNQTSTLVENTDVSRLRLLGYNIIDEDCLLTGVGRLVESWHSVVRGWRDFVCLHFQ